MIVLANRPDTSFCLISKSGRIHVVDRPGHPFLGNDFYRVCGDVFGCCPSFFWFDFLVGRSDICKK